MIIASAQTKPFQDDINANLVDHYRMINLATNHGADLIIFPEMSLTGYQRENASKCSFSENDDRIHDLRKLSREKNITIIVGAPIRIENSLYIGAFIIHPDNRLSIYTKRFLHTGEEIYLSPSDKFNPIIEIKDERISVAICADINHPEHPEKAKLNNTTLYLAGIFFEPIDMKKAYDKLSSYSRDYSMNILMSNFTGKSYGLAGGGQSGFWNNKGELIDKLNQNDSGILLFEKIDNNWRTKKIIYD